MISTCTLFVKLMHLSICWIGLVELASARNRGTAGVGRGVAMTDVYDKCDVEMPSMGF